MARSPWNFLARLTGRGRKMQDGSGNEGGVAKSGSEDRQDEILLILPAEPEMPTPEPDLEFDRALKDHSKAENDLGSTTAISAESEPDRLAIETPAALSLSNPEAAIPPISAGKSTKSTIAIRPTKRASAAQSPAEISVTAPAAFDEFLLLDREIQEVRRQLSEKLRSQNALLKKMLDRFNR